MEKVSVIIVTWNAEKFIKQCLDSVFSQGLALFEVFVVDNASADKTIEMIKKSFPQVRLIENKQNKGFCFANNQAINKAKGDYIFTLNSDIVLEPDYLARLLDCFKHDPRIGMAQGKFLRMDKLTIDSLGLRLGLCFRLFNIAEGKKDGIGFNDPSEIFGPCAAAALYCRKLLNDISWQDEVFDPEFFFLVEDFDLAWRARNRGWKGMYVPQAVCYHYRDSSGHRSDFRQYLSLRNRYYLLIKNLNSDLKSILRLVFAFMFYDLWRLVFFILFNRLAFKAFSEIRGKYPLLIEKRYKLKGNK